MARVCVMLARQRSGTGALGSMLDQYPGFSFIGEVFSPDLIGEKENYFTHLLERVTADTRNCLPNAHDENIATFFEKLCRGASSDNIIIDVKYNASHFLNGYWHGVYACPKLIEYSKAVNVPIIHLVRRNHLAVYVSGLIAELNAVWHTSDSNRISRRAVEVNVDDVKHYLHVASREDAIFTEFLAGYDRLLTIEYSQMFDQAGALASNVVEQIADLFSVEVVNGLMPVWVKQAPKKMRDAILNFDKVDAALNGTEFAWMTKE